MSGIRRSHIISAMVAALGGLLFGFDTAVISGTTPFIQPYFNLDEYMLGWTVSSLLLGCILGVISAGKPGDSFGRKKTLMFAALLFVFSALGSSLATSLSVFIVFRIIGGFAVGIASMLSPMYIAEISPAKYRGQLVSLNQLAIVIGILLAFISNYFLAQLGDHCWRYMLGVMALPALLFFVSLWFVPESPRWLMLKKQKQEALLVLNAINGPDEGAKEMVAIEQSLLSEGNSTYKSLFEPKMRKVLFIGIMLAVFSQITGINSIMYYAPVIFKNFGFATSSALIQTAIIGGINLIFTLVAIKLIDRFGRKPLMIFGGAGMFFSLTVISGAFFTEKFGSAIIMVYILIFIASFAVSIGPVSWVMISEIFPTHLRSKAMSVAIVSLWIANFLVTLLFPAMLHFLGGGYTFLFFDIMCLFLLFFIGFKLPETKGKSLEELSRFFNTR